jgi:hypothetical protein
MSFLFWDKRVGMQLTLEIPRATGPVLLGERLGVVLELERLDVQAGSRTVVARRGGGGGVWQCDHCPFAFLGVDVRSNGGRHCCNSMANK